MEHTFKQAMTNAFYKVGHALSDQLNPASAPQNEVANQKLDLIIDLLDATSGESVRVTSSTPISTSIQQPLVLVNDQTPIIGMSRTNGSRLQGVAHVYQSIFDILTTRLGTRVMRLKYGSVLPDLIDQPMNATWFAQVYIGIADALARWEPRFNLKRVLAAPGQTDGQVQLTLSGEVSL